MKFIEIYHNRKLVLVNYSTKAILLTNFQNVLKIEFDKNLTNKKHFILGE